MTGPSAIGSENGTPSSMMSAPLRSSSRMICCSGFERRIAGRDVRNETLAPFALEVGKLCFDSAHRLWIDPYRTPRVQSKRRSLVQRLRFHYTAVFDRSSAWVERSKFTMIYLRNLYS